MNELELDINIVDSFGWGLLHLAAAKSYKDMVLFLMNELGLSKNVKSNSGWGLLLCAAAHGQKDMVLF